MCEFVCEWSQEWLADGEMNTTAAFAWLKEHPASTKPAHGWLPSFLRKGAGSGGSFSFFCNAKKKTQQINEKRQTNDKKQKHHSVCIAVLHGVVVTTTKINGEQMSDLPG